MSGGEGGGRNLISRLVTLHYLKYLVFNKKIVRRAKKQEVMVPPWGGEGQLIETSPKEAQTLDCGRIVYTGRDSAQSVPTSHVWHVC